AAREEGAGPPLRPDRQRHPQPAADRPPAQDQQGARAPDPEPGAGEAAVVRGTGRLGAELAPRVSPASSARTPGQNSTTARKRRSLPGALPLRPWPPRPRTWALLHGAGTLGRFLSPGRRGIRPMGRKRAPAWLEVLTDPAAIAAASRQAAERI